MSDQRPDEQWRIKKELSLGDILAIFVALFAVASVYHKVDARLQMLEAERIERRETVAKFEAKAERKFEQIDTKLDRLLEAVLTHDRLPAQNGQSGMTGRNGR